MTDLYRINDKQRGDQLTSRYVEERRWLDNLKQSGVLALVDLDPVTQWCFSHQEAAWMELGTKDLICSRHLRKPCDVAEAAVVRMESE